MWWPPRGWHVVVNDVGKADVLGDVVGKADVVGDVVDQSHVCVGDVIGKADNCGLDVVWVDVDSCFIDVGAGASFLLVCERGLDHLVAPGDLF